MKKIFTITALFIGFTAFSQEVANKKIQAGLSTGVGFNLNQSGTNLITGKAGTDFIIGATVNWHFADKLSFTTGILFDLEAYKINVNNEESGDELYYAFDDKDILTSTELFGDLDKDATAFDLLNSNDYEGIFRVTERKQKPKYLTIPTMLMFHTQFYGYYRYFAKAGIRHSFLLSNRSNDTGAEQMIDANGQLTDVVGGDTELNGMKPKTELSFYRASVGLSAGMEWNFSGSTSLVGELGYYYGFTPIYRSEAITGNESKNMSFFQQGENDLINYKTFDTNQQQILLKVSILF
ncbi:MAG: outer membrane beta-barrel protein [Lishizhenia sp.]